MALPHPPLIDNGAIATIGIVSGPDRVAIVAPFIADDPGLTPTTRCVDLVAQIIANILTPLTTVMGTDAHVAFVQAEGMVDGEIPSRTDFAPGDYPGAGGSVVMPNNVSGLSVYYGNPADLAPGARMPVGKTFWPAVPSAEVTGDIISNVLFGNYGTIDTLYRTGFATFLGGGKWYRMAGKGNSRTAGTPAVSIISSAVRHYVATQRRRMTPH